jgi:hypothetical protein
MIAVAHRPRLQRRQIGAGPGLRVADAEVDLAAEDAGQEELLLLGGAEFHDARPDCVDGEHRHRRPGPHGLVEEDELLDLGAALPAVLRGPADAEPAVASHLAHDGTRRLADALPLVHGIAHLGRQQLGVVGAKLSAQRLLLGRVTDVHARP